MKIISLSTAGIPCGVADYNSRLGEAFVRGGHTYDTAPIDREAIEEAGRRANLLPLFRHFTDKIAHYDAVVLQHEFGLYGNSRKQANRTFRLLCKAVQAAKKPCVVILHTNLSKSRFLTRLVGFLPIGRFRTRREEQKLVEQLNRTVRNLIVHGRESRKATIEAGAEPAKVYNTLHPTEIVSTYHSPREISEDDIVNLTIFGFVSAYKGYRTAIQSLCVLPDRFRLTIAGGKHPGAINDKTLDDIHCFLRTGRWPAQDNAQPPVPAEQLAALRNRVRITGYLSAPEVEELMAATDIVLAPYTAAGPSGSGALGMSLSRGMPIIATGTPGFIDVQRESQCLKMVAIEAPFELAAAVEDLAKMPSERARLAKATLSFADSYRYDHLAQKVAQMLN